jgi:uncharacterized protein YecA (UPF0149 family)
LPIIFNEQEAGYATLEEAQAILGHLMALYNDINASVLEARVVLPEDCHVRPQALDNLDDSAPLARWSRGFFVGHDWLEELWDVELPDDLDQEIGVVLMTLSFFASRDLAQAFYAEGGWQTDSFEGLAESMLRVFPEALAEYAHLGRTVLGGAYAAVAQTPRRATRVGRNARCPCGSGKKFKKCCGDTPH